ncbi:MAG: hypothetical protein ACRD27_01900, partial [Terracidiphilus sp.]
MERRRGPAAWEFRYYVADGDGPGRRKRQHTTIGTLEQYPTAAAARKAVQVLLLDLNAEAPRAEVEVPTFGTLADKFVAEEMPERYSTRKSYESMLRTHIRPRWGDYPLDRVKPMVVEK